MLSLFSLVNVLIIISGLISLHAHDERMMWASLLLFISTVIVVNWNGDAFHGLFTPVIIDFVFVVLFLALTNLYYSIPMLMAFLLHVVLSVFAYSDFLFEQGQFYNDYEALVLKITLGQAVALFGVCYLRTVIFKIEEDPINYPKFRRKTWDEINGG